MGVTILENIGASVSDLNLSTYEEISTVESVGLSDGFPINCVELVSIDEQVTCIVSGLNVNVSDSISIIDKGYRRIGAIAGFFTSNVHESFYYDCDVSGRFYYNCRYKNFYFYNCRNLEGFYSSCNVSENFYADCDIDKNYFKYLCKDQEGFYFAGSV